MAIYRADGTEYKKVVTKDENTTAHMTAKGGYTGLENATGGYFRTPSNGLIPNVSGGSGYIGTSGWPFSAGYFNRFYVGGYANGNYHLSTASFICNSWIRSNGATGWYNETYGGGIYMEDVESIKTYNNKSMQAKKFVSADRNARCCTGNNADHFSDRSTYMEVAGPSSGAKGITWWASDKSLKEKIRNTRVNEALNKILQLKHVEFDFKENKEHIDLGYVADDIEKVLPCLTFDVEQYDGNNEPNGKYLKHINHTTMIPLITMGMQELIYENELLWTFNNQVVDEFEKRDKLIAELTARLEKLENGN